ncbi:MAG: hypothetical protein Q4E91_06255 [Lachnospiraceae bacterium]|nr:hypothetical protein [Lachnospiraceae bacterium]
MLTRECRSVLNELKLLTSNTEDEFSYLGDTTCFCLSNDVNQEYDYQKYQSEISSIMHQLEAEGYIITTWNEYHFQLTQKAIHEKQFKRHKRLEYISEKWISFIALIISALALLKSYGYGIERIIHECMKLLEQLLK